MLSVAYGVKRKNNCQWLTLQNDNLNIILQDIWKDDPLEPVLQTYRQTVFPYRDILILFVYISGGGGGGGVWGGNE